ncbi:MAG: alpha/beta hydrolase [Ruminococcaceae bacterium]|nr:alpha/beta hydrolase [Oscillospiraceae bacterium]
MKVLSLNLLDKKTEYDFMPTLTAYLLDGNPNETEVRPAVLVIPGGGYSHVSYREGERVALSYSAAGFHTFILDYCVAPHKHPYPIMNAAKSLEIIRANAKEWNVAADKIAVCGFSAGGHLAASISTLWNNKDIFSADQNANKLHRPDASILCYPVITCGEHAHKGSFISLTGSETENELWKKLSLENHVDENTPPAFLWHTYTDAGVPVENSLLYAGALRKYDIPFEMHIYPDGPHGMSRVSDETYWNVPKFTRDYPWIQQSIEWLYLKFGITKIEKE